MLVYYDAPQNLLTCQNCCNVAFEHDYHCFAGMLPPDRELMTEEFDVAATIQATGANLPIGVRREVLAFGA